MANLAELVTYEKEYPIEIVNHVTREPLGITINVVSKDSKRVTNALRDWQAAKWDADAKANKTEDSAKDRLEYIEAHGVETLVACISSWDWGDNEFDHIKGAGAASDEDKRYLVGHANAGWMIVQIAEAVHKIENFMQPSQTNARRGSKKT